MGCNDCVSTTRVDLARSTDKTKARSFAVFRLQVWKLIPLVSLPKIPKIQQCFWRLIQDSNPKKCDGGRSGTWSFDGVVVIFEMYNSCMKKDVLALWTTRH